MYLINDFKVYFVKQTDKDTTYSTKQSIIYRIRRTFPETVTWSGFNAEHESSCVSAAGGGPHGPTGADRGPVAARQERPRPSPGSPVVREPLPEGRVAARWVITKLPRRSPRAGELFWKPRNHAKFNGLHQIQAIFWYLKRKNKPDFYFR